VILRSLALVGFLLPASCASRELSTEASCGPSVAEYCSSRGCPLEGPTATRDVSTWCARAGVAYRSALSGISNCGPYMVLEISLPEGNESLFYANGSLIAVKRPSPFGQCVAGIAPDSCGTAGVGTGCGAERRGVRRMIPRTAISGPDVTVAVLAR